MSRLPIRIRLTLPFALAMALVLAALGSFVYLRVGSTLLASTDQSLQVAAAEALKRVEHGSPAIDRDAAAAASVAQILGANGAVVTSDPVGLPTLLPPSTVRSVLTGPELYTTVSIRGLDERWRLVALAARARGRPEVLVLGSSLRYRDESLERLRHELLFSSPLALLLATIAGYLLAGAALRPVEAMRRKAAAISAATPGSRLPVPASRDEVSRLAETLNEMLGRLETALEHERLFIAEASHELRTPLALLRTELDLALRKRRSRAELEEALRSAAEETERLTVLASNLLLIARSDDRGMLLQPEALSTRELLETVAARFSARTEQLGRSLEVAPGEDVRFEADLKSVEQALGNLVENALVHGTGTVTLSARRVGQEVELHVADEGPGFPAEFAGRAFDRFSRAEEARRRAGSGLGLAIVRAVALAHRGETGIGRSATGGADVWLALPLRLRADPARVRPARPERVRRAPAPDALAPAGRASEAGAPAKAPGS